MVSPIRVQTKKMNNRGIESPGLAIKPKPGTALILKGNKCTGNFCDMVTDSYYSRPNHVTTKQAEKDVFQLMYKSEILEYT